MDRLRCAVVQPLTGVPSQVVDSQFDEAAAFLRRLGYEPVFIGQTSGRRPKTCNCGMWRLAEILRTMASCQVMYVTDTAHIDPLTYRLRDIGRSHGMACYTRKDLANAEIDTTPDMGDCRLSQMTPMSQKEVNALLSGMDSL